MQRKPSTVVDYVQIATGIAVLMGLILVVYELRLSREIAQAQLMDNTYLSILDDARQRLGENFSDIEAKACLHPEQLSDGEIAAMNTFYSGYINRTHRLVRLSQYFEELNESVDLSARAALSVILSSEFGQRWLPATLELSAVPAETRAILSRMYDDMTVPEPVCQNFYPYLREYFPVEVDLPLP